MINVQVDVEDLSVVLDVRAGDLAPVAAARLPTLRTAFAVRFFIAIALRLASDRLRVFSARMQPLGADYL